MTLHQEFHDGLEQLTYSCERCSSPLIICPRCTYTWCIDCHYLASIRCPCCGAHPGAKDTYLTP